MDTARQKQQTVPAEWFVIGAIVIVSIILIIIIFAVLRPRLFSSTSPENTDPLLNPKGCITTLPPVGLMAGQVLTSRPNIDVSWDARTVTATPGEQILGYNIYISTNPNVTKSSASPIYTPVIFKRIFKTGGGVAIVEDTTYYYRVSTVDTCGEGELSSEEVSFTPVLE